MQRIKKNKPISIKIVRNNNLQFWFSVFRISRDLTWNMSRLLLCIRRIFGLFDPFHDALPDVLAFTYKWLTLYSTSRHSALKDHNETDIFIKLSTSLTQHAVLIYKVNIYRLKCKTYYNFKCNTNAIILVFENE